MLLPVLAILGIALSVGLASLAVGVISEVTSLQGASMDVGYDIAPDGKKAKASMKNDPTNENPTVATVDPSGKVHIQSGPNPSNSPSYVTHNENAANWDD